MSDRSALEAAAANFYEKRGRADLEEALKLYHPDCSFRLVGTDQLGAFTQPVQTLEALRGTAKHLFETWDLSGLHSVSVNVDGDTVFVHRAGPVRHTPSDTSFDTEMMDVFTFKDGLILDYKQFVDTYKVAEVTGIIAA
jgi:ketosteroid isomerase-like protein